MYNSCLLYTSLESIRPYAHKEQSYILCSKGVERTTGKLLTTVMSEVLGTVGCNLAVLSGPNHAEEIEMCIRDRSNASMETLAVIAYKQPITKAEIEEIRVVNSDKIIKQLLTRSLIAELGHKDTVGRPILYGTTDEFLRSAGVESIEALHQEVSETEG